MMQLVMIGERLSIAILALGLAGGLSVAASAQESAEKPAVVQPGAPGEPSRILSSSTRAVLPPHSAKDVEFMQGMIMHHAQAVEMTALINGRTQNSELRLLGARISHSQTEEMTFMKRWLAVRGEPAEMKMAQMPSHHSHGNMSSMNGQMLMPGMLTAKQMDSLRKAKGKEFDRLFLEGMIQHHEGALVMVQDLFDTAGTGQDANLFNFATDVDSGQRAEIRRMKVLLGEKP